MKMSDENETSKILIQLIWISVLKKKIKIKRRDGWILRFSTLKNERVERRRRVFKFHPLGGQGVKMKPSISRVKKKVIVKTKKKKNIKKFHAKNKEAPQKLIICFS